jgi:hypothetical protein
MVGRREVIQLHKVHITVVLALVKCWEDMWWKHTIELVYMLELKLLARMLKLCHRRFVL